MPQLAQRSKPLYRPGELVNGVALGVRLDTAPRKPRMSPTMGRDRPGTLPYVVLVTDMSSCENRLPGLPVDTGACGPIENPSRGLFRLLFADDPTTNDLLIRQPQAD